MIEGKGPFSKLGQNIFDIYWKYYPKYRTPGRKYTSLDEFIELVHNNITAIDPNYSNSNEVFRQIKAYKRAREMLMRADKR